MKYVSAKFGNNANSGDNLKNSKLTIAAAAALDTSITIHSGKYLEQNLPTGKVYSGIGNVTFDGSIFNTFITGSGAVTVTNANIINYTNVTGAIYNFTMDKCFFLNSVHNYNSYTDRTIIKTNKAITFNTGSNYFRNSTIYGTSGMFTLNLSSIPNNNLNVIIHSKPTTFQNIYSCLCKFWHFYSVPITLGGVAVTYDGTLGKTIDDLRARAAVVFGGVASDYFQNCKVYNASTTDCFINENLDIREGFYLKPTSPSAKANYITGKHIGAMPVARGPIFPTDYTLGSNIGTDGKLIDPLLNAEADNTIEYTNAFDHGKIILVEQWGEGIVEAPRNGDYSSVDRDTDIDANLKGNGTTLENSEVYVCEIESLSISNGTTTKIYAVGENCTVDATGVWTVIAVNGKMRKLFTTITQVINVLHSRNDNTFTNELAAITPRTHLRYFARPLNAGVETNPMCHVDSSGMPVLGDADTDFTYGVHATYGSPVRVQFRYEKRRRIMQTKNAKS